MDRLLGQGFWKIDNVQCLKRAFLRAYSTAYAKLLINAYFSIGGLDYALISLAVDRAHPHAEEIPATLRVAFLLLDYAYSGHNSQISFSFFKSC